MRMLSLLLVAPLAACGVFGGNDSPGLKGEGSGSSRSYAASGFTEVELRGSDDVDVRVGPDFSVRAEGGSTVLDKLKIERDGDKLRIGRRSGVSFDDSTATIHVTMPLIRVASIAGSGDLSVDKVPGGAFKGSIAGSGNLKLAQLATDSTDLSIAGSGDVEAAGSTGRLTIEIAGSGDVKGERLSATGADISIAGSGGVKAQVKGQAKVRSMGSGDVDLGPDARCDSKVAGSGEVRCGG